MSNRECMQSSSFGSVSACAIEFESSAGLQMSHNIDNLIREANEKPLRSSGYFNMYWQGGRVQSIARDYYLATVLRDPNISLRPFEFSDCGLRPLKRRFEVKLLCTQTRYLVRKCCTNESCQNKFMSRPYALGRMKNF